MKFKMVLAVLVAGACVLLTSCEQGPRLEHFSGPAQGSTYNITYWSEQPIAAPPLQQAVETELARIDQLMSNYRPDSVIEQFNQQQTVQPVDVGPELVQLVEQARQITAHSGGCYDLTVKPLFELWGFKNDVFHHPTDAAIAALKADIGMDKLLSSAGHHLQKQRPNLRVDVSSIAQGYTVARLAQILQNAGVQHFLVEVGGELITQGQKPDQQPWKVAIEKPLPGDQRLHKIIAISQTQPLSVMTSGTYRHYFDNAGQRYSHVLDARSGAPVRHHTVSTTVLIDDPTLGDAWSTTFLCLGSQEGLALANKLGLKVLFIDQQGEDLIELSSQALQQSKGVQWITP